MSAAVDTPLSPVKCSGGKYGPVNGAFSAPSGNKPPMYCVSIKNKLLREISGFPFALQRHLIDSGHINRCAKSLA